MIIEYEFHVIYNKVYECHSNITKRESCINTMGLFTLRSNVLHIYSHLIYIYIFLNSAESICKKLCLMPGRLNKSSLFQYIHMMKLYSLKMIKMHWGLRIKILISKWLYLNRWVKFCPQKSQLPWNKNYLISEGYPGIPWKLSHHEF